jgi:DNA-binding NarL/FixJ family response regulator
MAGEVIDVVLVEDNDIFRETLELLIDVTPDMRVAGAVGDGEEAVETCRKLQPDVVLMDYRLPGLDGVEATGALRAACPEAAVVVLTAVVEPEELEALRQAGAVACLTKDRELDEIVGAIRSAAERR